jgi:hypothetical protein
MLNDNYLNAIIVCGKREKRVGGLVINPQFLKYHNIRNSPGLITAFMKFAATKKDAQYVNFYYKQSEMYAFRRYFEAS